MSRIASFAFNGGVIDPIMDARVDHEKYKSGCNTLHNFVCLPQGPATRRPGTEYIANAATDAVDQNVRLVPFVFSATESRILEFSNNQIRVFNGSTPLDTVATTFSSAQIPFLRFAQSADVVFIASPSHRPSKLSRFADTNWVLSDIDFLPDATAPTNLQATKTSTTSEVNFKYVVTTIDATSGEESLPSNNVSISSGPLSTTDTITLTWTAAANAAEYRVYKFSAGVYGYMGTATAPTVTFLDDNIAPDTADTPPSGEDPFTSAGNYPSLVYFWQQRLGWASTNNQPFTFWMSPSAQLESLATSVPPNDDDAIEVTLAAGQANRVQWVAPSRLLLCATTGNEWAIGKDGEALTPSNTTFSLQGSTGAESLPPIEVDSMLIYLQRGGTGVTLMAYAYDQDKYVPGDLSIISENILANNPIVAWAHQVRPYSIIWCVLEDGTMAGLSFLQEHKVVGWHTHATDGFVEDVISVPGTRQDEVWLLVRREINGVTKRYIERMGEYFVKQTDPKDAYFVDSGVTYSGAKTDTLTNIAPHLVGETVKIWADGAEQPEKVVAAGGTVTLDVAASEVHVGLGYDSVLKPTRPEVTTEQGTTLTEVYKVSKSNIKFYKSMGVLVGADEDDLEEVLVHSAGDPIPPSFESGTVEVPIDSDWEDEWDLTIKTQGPAPTTVVAAVYEVEVGEML